MSVEGGHYEQGTSIIMIVYSYGNLWMDIIHRASEPAGIDHYSNFLRLGLDWILYLEPPLCG